MALLESYNTYCSFFHIRDLQLSTFRGFSPDILHIATNVSYQLFIVFLSGVTDSSSSDIFREKRQSVYVFHGRGGLNRNHSPVWHVGWYTLAKDVFLHPHRVGVDWQNFQVWEVVHWFHWLASESELKVNSKSKSTPPLWSAAIAWWRFRCSFSSSHFQVFLATIW